VAPLPAVSDPTDALLGTVYHYSFERDVTNRPLLQHSCETCIPKAPTACDGNVQSIVMLGLERHASVTFLT